MKRNERLERALAELGHQRQWMKDHGGTRFRYVLRYGSGRAPEPYGEGGEAIYEADLAALRRAEEAVRKILKEVKK